MTVGNVTYTWTNKPEDPAFNRCSPNLILIGDELAARWGMKPLGCYGERPIRGGEKPSAHSHGAATDYRWQDVPGDPKYQGLIGRARLDAEVLPWLIGNSLELHVGAIHDYTAARVWHADRAATTGNGWRPASKNSSGKYNDPNMGDAGAGWIHVEVTLTGWADSTPLAKRTVTAPVPTPTPPPTAEVDMARAIQPNDNDAAVFITDGIVAASVHSYEALLAQAAAGLIPTMPDGKPIVQKVPRLMLKALRLLGPLPNYAGVNPGVFPKQTVAADFGAHEA